MPLPCILFLCYWNMVFLIFSTRSPSPKPSHIPRNTNIQRSVVRLRLFQDMKIPCFSCFLPSTTEENNNNNGTQHRLVIERFLSLNVFIHCLWSLGFHCRLPRWRWELSFVHLQPIEISHVQFSFLGEGWRRWLWICL